MVDGRAKVVFVIRGGKRVSNAKMDVPKVPDASVTQQHAEPPSQQPPLQPQSAPGMGSKETKKRQEKRKRQQQRQQHEQQQMLAWLFNNGLAVPTLGKNGGTPSSRRRCESRKRKKRREALQRAQGLQSQPQPQLEGDSRIGSQPVAVQ